MGFSPSAAGDASTKRVAIEYTSAAANEIADSHPLVYERIVELRRGQRETYEQILDDSTVSATLTEIGVQTQAVAKSIVAKICQSELTADEQATIHNENLHGRRDSAFWNSERDELLMSLMSEHTYTSGRHSGLPNLRTVVSILQSEHGFTQTYEQIKRRAQLLRES